VEIMLAVSPTSTWTTPIWRPSRAPQARVRTSTVSGGVVSGVQHSRSGQGWGTEATRATTDSQLVGEARAVYPRAFGQLVRHAPIARRMAILWGADADADEVMHDAFVRP
jgi:hypothetical protein